MNKKKLLSDGTKFYARAMGLLPPSPDKVYERIRNYATGKQNVNAYLKALGYPPETKQQIRERKARVAELEALWNKLTGGDVIQSVVEWNCKGYLGKRI